MPLSEHWGDLHKKAARALLRAAFINGCRFRFRRYIPIDELRKGFSPGERKATNATLKPVKGTLATVRNSARCRYALFAAYGAVQCVDQHLHLDELAAARSRQSKSDIAT